MTNLRIVLHRDSSDLASTDRFYAWCSIFDINRDLVISQKHWRLNFNWDLADSDCSFTFLQKVEMRVKISFFEEGAAWRQIYDREVAHLDHNYIYFTFHSLKKKGFFFRLFDVRLKVIILRGAACIRPNWWTRRNVVNNKEMHQGCYRKRAKESPINFWG